MKPVRQPHDAPRGGDAAQPPQAQLPVPATTDLGAAPAESPDVIPPSNRLIAEALRGLRYGQVTVTVQDGVVVQVDRLERWRTNS